MAKGGDELSGLDGSSEEEFLDLEAEGCEWRGRGALSRDAGGAD